MNPVPTRKTSLVDVPKKHDATDHLDIKRYEDALVKLIKGADTPLTIALQGEWGSGKTSLMNTLRYRLVESPEECCFYHVWVNTWEYSIMGQPEDAIRRILRSIIMQIARVAPEENKSLAEKAMEHVNMAGRGLGIALQVGINAVAKSTAGVDNLTGMGKKSGDNADSDSNPESGISQAKAEIRKMLEKCLTGKGSTKSGFVFFIDDLDRIDPSVAVQILELLKNIFDLEKCIFVLAIDYDVVVKGLIPKYGLPTPETEREFRSFFDKIIQLPFSMPVAKYQIDDFLIGSLQKIGFIKPEEAETPETKQALSKFARASVGTNPRSLKRLVNILSLLKLIGDEVGTQAMFQKHVDFALVCIQISYPVIYNVLTAYPDFMQWDEGLERKLDLKPLSDDEKNQLKAREEFDEPWEQLLYQLCKRDPFLKSRAFDVSGILNGIRELIPESERLDKVMKSALLISSVTHVITQSQEVVSAPEFYQSMEIKRLNEKLLPTVNVKLISDDFGKVNQTSGRIKSWLSYVASGNDGHDYGCKVSVWPEDEGMTVAIASTDWLLWNDTKGSNFVEELTSHGIELRQFSSIKNQLLAVMHENSEFKPSFDETTTHRRSGGVLFFDLNWQLRFRLETLNDVFSDRFVDIFATVIREVFKAKRCIRQLFDLKVDEQTE